MSEKDKAALSNDAKQQLKQRTEEFLDNEDIDFDGDYSDEPALNSINTNEQTSLSSRRKLEDYLEERRLQRELGDDFDL